MSERPILIDWSKFAARVSVGTAVRCENPFSQGIILENYPHAQEERYTSYERPIFTTPSDLERDLFWLRYQEFDTSIVRLILPYSVHTRYLINGQWRTFDEVMA